MRTTTRSKARLIKVQVTRLATIPHLISIVVRLGGMSFILLSDPNGRPWDSKLRDRLLHLEAYGTPNPS